MIFRFFYIDELTSKNIKIQTSTTRLYLSGYRGRSRATRWKPKRPSSSGCTICIPTNPDSPKNFLPDFTNWNTGKSSPSLLLPQNQWRPHSSRTQSISQFWLKSITIIGREWLWFWEFLDITIIKILFHWNLCHLKLSDS